MTAPDLYVTALDLDCGRTVVRHRRGVPAWKLPPPPRWHRCFPQTRATFDWFTEVEKCPCGGLRYVHGPGSGVWIEQNTWKPHGRGGRVVPRTDS